MNMLIADMAIKIIFLKAKKPPKKHKIFQHQGTVLKKLYIFNLNLK